MLNRLSPQGAPSMSRFLCDSPEVASACSVHGTTPTAASASLRGSIPSRTAQNTSHLFSHTGKEFPVSTDEEERLLRSPLSTLTPLRSNQLPTQRRHARWSSTCKRHSAACPAAPRTRRLLQPPAHVPPAPPAPCKPRLLHRGSWRRWASENSPSPRWRVLWSLGPASPTGLGLGDGQDRITRLRFPGDTTASAKASHLVSPDFPSHQNTPS